MRHTLYAALLLSSLSLSAAEPSVFGAGNLDSDNPYGLTDAEKKILENKQTLQQNNRKLRSQNTEIEALRERVDGLQSVLEAIAMKSQENKVALNDISKSRKNADDSEVQRLKSLEEKVIANSENILQLKEAIEALTEQSVSKAEYNALVNDVNTFKSLVASELKKKPTKNSTGKISNGDLATKALNSYENKSYTQALQEYKELVNRNYKPANSHFMIGQIYYATKDYGKAIAHYKESASRYSKASYMPTLMFRTAVSMEKTGDKQHAKTFYSAVITKFPDSAEARESRKRLDNLR